MSIPACDLTSKDIYLYYFCISDNFDDGIIPSLISTFSFSAQQFLNSIQNKEAQKRTLFGRIILRYIASRLEIVQPEFVSLIKSGKPVFTIPNGFDFNISHSGKMVVCGITKGSCFGIDIEVNRPINFEVYRSYFNFQEWQFIKESENPELTFLKLWVRKEAIIKADGRGLGLDLSLINCLWNEVNVGIKTYFIEDINVEFDYTCAIACSTKKTIKLIDFNEIFNKLYCIHSTPLHQNFSL